jgi:hypothetical protein
MFFLLQSENKRTYVLLGVGGEGGWGGGWHWQEWGGGGERGKRINMVQIMCTHVCKYKMISVETVAGIGAVGIKERVTGGEFKYDVFDTLLEPL